MQFFRLNQRNSTSSKQDVGKSHNSIPMAFHGSLQDSDNEVCLANTILKDDPEYHKKLAEVTIPDVVWRGTKIREIKPKPDKTKHEYFVPDVDFFESFVKQPRERKGHLGVSRKNTRLTCTPGSRCVCIRPTPAACNCLSINSGSRNNTIKIVPKTKTEKGKRCPIRIAELAVPTKRQCIATWRNKSDILPVNMIDRLKQRVMDQTPIAGIPDAIYCFQSRRRLSPKKCSFRWLPSKHKTNETQKSSRMDTRILCIIFANRVAKRLSIRLNLDLNSNLRKLSNIVSSDIAKIMYKSQCRFGKDQTYKAIHADVSNTITVWITGILGDLSDKLLEEELRVKKEKKAQEEAQIETMLEFYERFIAIIDTIIEQENKQSKDLEEEEGPVLDFIDDVVYNVLNICDPPQLHYDADSIGSGSCQDQFEDELLEALDKKGIFNSEEFVQSDDDGETEDAVTDNYKMFTDSEHFRNEIIDIIENITKESEDGRSNSSWNGMEIEGILVKSVEDKINIRNNEEVLLNADTGHDINVGINEEVSPNADMEHDINVGNNEEVSPNADMEHDINVGNNEEVSPNADMEHDINVGNNEEVSPNADIEHDINVGNNEEVSPNPDMEHDINVGNNEEVSPNADMKHDINVGNNEEVLPNADTEHDINDRNKEEVLAKTGMEHNLNDENIDQIDDDSRNLKENDDADDNLEETRSNVSERLEIFIDGIDDDKNSKKVMFPYTDLVNPNNPADQNNTSTAKKPAAPKSNEYKQPRWNSQTNKPNIIFSEPNQDLLSDADESWPSDLSDKPAVKVSEIASKSVSSLGKITEYDEKQMTLPEEEEEDSMTNIATDGTILQANDIMKKIDNKLPTEKHGTASLGNITEHDKKRMTSQEKDSMTNIATDGTILQANDIMKKIDNKLPTEKHGTASLGNITEHDKKQMTSQEKDSMTDIGTDDAILQANEVMKKRDDKLPTEKYGTASQSNEPLIKVSIETSSSEPSFTKSVPKIKKDNDIGITITVPKVNKYPEHQTDSGESEFKRTDSSTDWREDDKIPRQKNPPLSVDYGWKVHFKTAPSWVTASTWGQGRGEPSDDSIPIQIMPTLVKESELRKWCKNLQDAFLNLKMWSSWISATCKESLILLKQKESACPGLAQRAVISWSRHKRNVRKDALLWTKLYQRMNTNFQNFKREYDNVEIVAAEYRTICNCVNTNH